MKLYSLKPSSTWEYVSLMIFLLFLIGTPTSTYFFQNLEILAFLIFVGPSFLLYLSCYRENEKRGLKKRIYGMTEHEYLCRLLVFHTEMPYKHYAQRDKNQLTELVRHYKINSLVK